MTYLGKGFGPIASLKERKQVIAELKASGYQIKLNARAARNPNENVTVFYNSANYKYAILFNNSYTCFYCESYFHHGSKFRLD